MKEIIGKSKIQSKTLPKRISVNINGIYSECEIASHVNPIIFFFGGGEVKLPPPPDFC